MSAHVVVIDSSVRRVNVKVGPSTHLSDVLGEACVKLGLSPNQFTLRNHNKQVDLSRTFRLSGLSSGAKLELVQKPRTPSAVSVALQLPAEAEAAAHGIPNSRLTDKFSSATTLWLILRKFESVPAGSSKTMLNFTGRSKIQLTGSGNSGRLYYETPVLQIMGKELSSFSDFQKSLSQLGLNDGSVLIRLSFRPTQVPLEEAMAEIDNYFADVKTDEESNPHASSAAVPELARSGQTSESVSTSESPEPLVATPSSSELTTNQDENVDDGDTVADNAITGPHQRQITVFLAPSSSAPQATQYAYDDKDYELTIEQAKLHQKRLQQSSQNTRLLSDAEISAKKRVEEEHVAKILEVNIKIRLPDQMQIQTKFTNLDTGASLYACVKDVLDRPEEPFTLNYLAPDGTHKTVPNEASFKLISDLGMHGNTLINLAWGASASVEAKARPALRKDLREKAQEMQIEDVKAIEVEEEQVPQPRQVTVSKALQSGGHRGTPKWLKLPGKR